MIPAHAAVGILFLSVSAFADSQKTITALIPSTVPPPLLLSLEPAPQGLIKDYVEALSDEMGVQVSFLVIPRKRLNEYISSGKADINCYSNPIWNDDPTLFFWSQTLFFVRDIIVGRSSPDKQLQVPKSLNEFNGQAIGTIQGYRYPKLDPYFKTKSMIRDDAVNEESNLNKLFHAHLPFIVIDQLYLKYYRKNHLEAPISHSELIVQDYPVQCGLSKRSTLSLRRLNNAISSLKESKKLDRIFNKYQ